MYIVRKLGIDCSLIIIDVLRDSLTVSVAFSTLIAVREWERVLSIVYKYMIATKHGGKRSLYSQILLTYKHVNEPAPYNLAGSWRAQIAVMIQFWLFAPAPWWFGAI